MSLFLNAATILAVFDISKAVDRDGKEIEPKMEWTHGITSYVVCWDQEVYQPIFFPLQQASRTFRMPDSTKVERTFGIIGSGSDSLIRLQFYHSDLMGRKSKILCAKL